MPYRTFVAEIVHTMLFVEIVYTTLLGPQEFGTKKIWHKNYLNQSECTEIFPLQHPES